MNNYIKIGKASRICDELGLDQITKSQLLHVMEYPVPRSKFGAEIVSYLDEKESENITRRHLANVLNIDYDSLNEGVKRYHPELVKKRQAKTDVKYSKWKNISYGVTEMGKIFLEANNDTIGPRTDVLLKLEERERSPSDIKRNMGYDYVRHLFEMESRGFVKKVWPKKKKLKSPVERIHPEACVGAAVLHKGHGLDLHFGEPDKPLG